MYENLVGLIYGAIWATTPETFAQLEAVLRHRIEFGKLSAADLKARLAGADYGEEKPQQETPGVALVQVHGPILNRAGMFADISGGVSPQGLESTMRRAADDKGVPEIVMSFDSGGGEVLNIDEAAAAIAYAASLKPVTAVCNGLTGSAAYWLASQASEIVATPLSQVGSIGVLTTHADRSKALEKDGLDVRVYRSASQKALGQPSDPNDETLGAATMAKLNAVLQVFAETVGRGRGLTANEVLNRFALDVPGSLKGDTVLGAEAVRLGLADRVGGLNEVLSGALARTQKTSYPKRPPMKGNRMNAEMLALLGLDETATTEQVSAALKARETAAQTRAETAHSKAVAETLGLEPDKLDAELPGLKTQAEDGRAYRADLLTKLEQSVIRAQGNDEAGQRAAERAKRLFANASIADLRDEVEAQEIKAAEVIPTGRLSKEKKARQPVRTGSY